MTCRKRENEETVWKRGKGNERNERNTTGRKKTKRKSEKQKKGRRKQVTWTESRK